MTRRWHRRFAIAALLALLLQQVAIAGHICLAGAPDAVETMQTTDADVSMPCHASAASDESGHPSLHSDSGCRQHCDAGQTRVEASLAGSVPMLPPAAAWQPVPQTVRVSSQDDRTSNRNGDPPPRQRFCSLLI